VRHRLELVVDEELLVDGRQPKKKRLVQEKEAEEEEKIKKGDMN